MNEDKIFVDTNVLQGSPKYHSQLAELANRN